MEASLHRAQQARLAELVKAWNSRGVALPVAVAVSILDDLLAQPETPSRRPRLDDVVIDHRGVAMLTSDDPGNLDDMAPLLAEMLGDGSEHDAVPANARMLLARLTSDDPTERPRDADQLRSWIRETLGAPAAREEVIACVGAAIERGEESLLPPPSLIDELLPHPDPIEDDENLPTLPPQISEPRLPRSKRARRVELTAEPAPEPAPEPALKPVREPEIEPDLETPEPVSEFAEFPEFPELAELADLPRKSSMDLVKEATISEGHHPSVDGERYHEDRIAQEALAKSARPTPVERLMRHVHSMEDGQPTMPPIDPNRPVVRVQSASGPRASVGTAPAARRNPRPLTEAGDSLILPAERRGNWGVWLLVLAVVAAALYYYLF